MPNEFGGYGIVIYGPYRPDEIPANIYGGYGDKPYGPVKE